MASHVPKFGEWDGSNPASAEGFTHIFNKVRDARKAAETLVPATSQQRHRSFSMTKFLETQSGASELGYVFGELLSAVFGMKGRAVKFRPILERLESTLASIEPVIKQIEQYDKKSDWPKEKTEKLIKEMQHGTEFVLKCSKVKWWEYYVKLRYQQKLEALDESLHRFFNVDMQPQMAQDQKEVLQELRHSHMGPSMDKAHTGSSSSLPVEEEFPYVELLNLILIRDFISLLLTYPVKVADDESLLKAWLLDVSELTAQLSAGLPTDDYDLIREKSRFLTEKPRRYLEGLLPVALIEGIKREGRHFFGYNRFFWVHEWSSSIAMPKAVFDLTVDLAVGQLIQTLFSADDYVRNIHYIRLSTRDDIEKRAVMEKIEAALRDKHNMFGIDKAFRGAIQIDSSLYESDVEIHVQKEITRQLIKHVKAVETEDDDMLPVGLIEEEMASNRYLMLLVDGDSNKKLDPEKVYFPNTKVAGMSVLITTEPSVLGNDEDEFTRAMDLNIRTEDHLLPWEVFWRTVGTRCSTSAFLEIALKIVKECSGHLLAIDLVAKSLKNVEDVKLWELAVDKLHYMNPSYDYQESDRIGISRVMVNAFINLIWEGITERQKLFLELSLFVPKIKDGVSSDILISEWVSTEVARTEEEAKHGIAELLDRSILLLSENGYVRLPKETYDILESLHCSNPSFIRRLCSLGLMELPHIGQWHGLIRIELMDNNLSELPESPDCPKLEVLLLQGNVDLTEIPDSFFDNMPQLRHLDLSYTSIRFLPASISNLVKLREFYLRGCELFMELSPEIGQLKNLEKLDLDGTLIAYLPKEIRELTNLQSLKICFHGYHHKKGSSKKIKQRSSSTIIPRGVISNLSQLNHLSINVDPEDERWYEDVTIITSEILGLWNLESLNIYIPSFELLENISNHLSLDFRLIVGNHMQRFVSRTPLLVEEKFKESDRSLKFVNGINVPDEVSKVIAHSRALYLDRHLTIKSLSEFQLKNLRMLRLCILGECNEMQTIVDGSYSYDEYPLLNLEFLGVFYMKNLKSICQGPTSPSFLHWLRYIGLHTCPMLTTIFTLDFLDNLYWLEELIVEDCPRITTLISHNSREYETQNFLPRLRIISLLYLPELVSISNGLHIGTNLEKLGVFCCPNLQTLSEKELSSKCLKIIKGDSKWWEALKWNESEWKDGGRPDSLNLIFSPINEDANIVTQLLAHDDEIQQQVEEPVNNGKKVAVRDDSTAPAVTISKLDMHLDPETCSGIVEPMNEIEEEAMTDDDSATSIILKPDKHSEEAEKVKKMPKQEKSKTHKVRWNWLPKKYVKGNEMMQRYAYKELEKATSGFTELIGQGGFGKVYRGILPTSKTPVAVKRISRVSDVTISEPEIAIIGRLWHRNLVPLLGWCRHRGELLLVNEFMVNSSLDKYLFDNSKFKTILSWEQRFNIIKGVASALVYVHECCEMVVIHRDVKAANVLLDTEFNGRLGDFDLAMLCKHGASPRPTEHVVGNIGSPVGTTGSLVGTIGYMAPECFQKDEVTTRSDVYSFGALLLEVACGQRISRQIGSPGDLPLMHWVWAKYEEGRMFDVVDPNLNGSFDDREVLVVLKLGLMCLNPDPSFRPTMKRVVSCLDGEVELPDYLIEPREIAHFRREGFYEDLHSAAGSTFSSNEFPR